MEVGKRMFTFEIENIEEEKNYYVRPLFKIYDKTMVSDDRAEYEILVGKWQVITQIDTYINNSDGHQIILPSGMYLMMGCTPYPGVYFSSVGFPYSFFK